jgi:hypothetical protein
MIALALTRRTGHSALPRRSGCQTPTSGLLRSMGWHPDLGAERTRPRDLGIWAPLIEPQQVEPASVAPRSSELPLATEPTPNCRTDRLRKYAIRTYRALRTASAERRPRGASRRAQIVWRAPYTRRSGGADADDVECATGCVGRLLDVARDDRRLRKFAVAREDVASGAVDREYCGLWLWRADGDLATVREREFQRWASAEGQHESSARRPIHAPPPL